jgi:hypothetical protein
MSVTPSGHIEELPGGSFRVAVYLGTDPVTRKRMSLRETVKGTTEAQITLARLPAKAQAGKNRKPARPLPAASRSRAPCRNADLRGSS